jgi:hypothetical protein
MSVRDEQTVEYRLWSDYACMMIFRMTYMALCDSSLRSVSLVWLNTRESNDFTLSMGGELGPDSCSHARRRHSCYCDNHFLQLLFSFLIEKHIPPTQMTNQRNEMSSSSPEKRLAKSVKSVADSAECRRSCTGRYLLFGALRILDQLTNGRHTEGICMLNLNPLLVNLCKWPWSIRAVVVRETKISFLWFVIRRGGICFSIGTNKGVWKAIRRISSMPPTGTETAARPKFTIHDKQTESFLDNQCESFKASTQKYSERWEQRPSSICYKTNFVSVSFVWWSFVLLDPYL